MGFYTGSSTDYQDLLADLRTAAVTTEGTWAEGTGTAGGRYTDSTEDEWIATGEGDGGDAITIGIRTYSDEQGDWHNWEIAGMDSYTDANTWENQPGISDGRYDGAGDAIYGSYVPLCNRTMNYWFSVTSYRICGVVQVGDIFSSFYLGWGNRLDTEGNYADPKVCAGTMPDPNLRYSAGHVLISGVANPIGDRFFDTTRNSPFQVHTRAGAWQSYAARELSNDNTTQSTSRQTHRSVWPAGEVNIGGLYVNEDSWVSTQLTGASNAFTMQMVIPGSSADSDAPGNQRAVLRRTPNGVNEDAVKRFPCIAYGSPGDTEEFMVELDGMGWCSGAAGPNDPALQPGDRLEDVAGGTFFRVFPMGSNKSESNYLWIEEK